MGSAVGALSISATESAEIYARMPIFSISAQPDCAFKRFTCMPFGTESDAEAVCGSR